MFIESCLVCDDGSPCKGKEDVEGRGGGGGVVNKDIRVR